MLVYQRVVQFFNGALPIHPLHPIPTSALVKLTVGRSRFTPAFKDQSEGNTPQWLDTWRSNRLKQETSWKHEEVGNVTGLALNSLIHRHFLWAYWLSMVKSLSLRSGDRQPPLWGVGLRERILVTTEKHQKNHQRATSTAFEFGQRDKTSQL